VRAGASPAHVAVHGDLVFVSNNGGDTVSVLRPSYGAPGRDAGDVAARIVAEIGVGSGPFGMALTPAAGGPLLWVASFGSDRLVAVRPPSALFPETPPDGRGR
jgi:DNA-binding beta-propeller fold protein YncE